MNGPTSGSRMWVPSGAVRFDGIPTPGTRLAFESTAWWVLAVDSLVADSAAPDLPGQISHHVWVRPDNGPRIPRRLDCHTFMSWWVYPYGRRPTCIRCRQPPPCLGHGTDPMGDNTSIRGIAHHSGQWTGPTS